MLTNEIIIRDNDNDDVVSVRASDGFNHCDYEITYECTSHHADDFTATDEHVHACLQMLAHAQSALMQLPQVASDRERDEIIACMFENCDDLRETLRTDRARAQRAQRVARMSSDFSAISFS